MAAKRDTESQKSTSSSCRPRGRPLGRKENDWVLYAYIIKCHGGEISLSELQNQISKFKRRDCRTRSIGNRLRMNKKKGFKIERTYTHQGSYVSIWSFSGELPQISRRTLKDWDSLLSLRDNKPPKI